MYQTKELFSTVLPNSGLIKLYYDTDTAIVRTITFVTCVCGGLYSTMELCDRTATGGNHKFIRNGSFNYFVLFHIASEFFQSIFQKQERHVIA